MGNVTNKSKKIKLSHILRIQVFYICDDSNIIHSVVGGLIFYIKPLFQIN